MAPYRILRIDNLDDNKVLKSHSRPVKVPNLQLRSLVDDMIATMHAANGVGLAAVQIGVLQRIVVIFISAEDDDTTVDASPNETAGQTYVLINPEIIKASPDMETILDGCLSLPEWYGEVSRSTWVTVEYQDLHGKRHRIRKAEGLLSHALQHEIDHLNGILYTERIVDISTLKRYRPTTREREVTEM